MLNSKIYFLEHQRIKEFKKLETSASSAVKKVTGTIATYKPNSQIAL